MYSPMGFDSPFDTFQRSGSALSFPVTPGDVTISASGAGVVQSGVAIPQSAGFWGQFTYNMTDLDGHTPMLVFYSGGSSGTLVARLGLSGANNALSFRIATGALSTSYPYGFTLTDLASDFGVAQNSDKTVTFYFEAGNATASAEIDAGNGSPTVTTIDTSTTPAATMDWIGFCAASATGSGLISNITFSDTDPRL